MHWEIYCRAIDNFGDLGVCWRLARQLAAAGDKVRLIVDAPDTLRRLAPDPEGVEILAWPENAAAAAGLGEAEGIVEAFACELPAAVLETLAQRPNAPVWINLEYLSAEDWVEDCHALPSPHPGLPLVKHFFFPGFTDKTGGILAASPRTPSPTLPRWGRGKTRPQIRSALPLPREGEDEAADTTCPSPQRGEVGRGANGQEWISTPDLRSQKPDNTLNISLFCYAHAPLARLIDAFAAHPTPSRCFVADGQPADGLRQIFGDAPWQAGRARFIRLPFLPQSEFDALLDACDLNFVRGEDSFVRAQWSGKPLVWHIYRQDEAAHAPKLDAFLRRYGEGLPADEAAALGHFWRVWNGLDGLNAPDDFIYLWQTFAKTLPTLTCHARTWRENLVSREDLAAKLRRFAQDRL
ncbi:MAG: elongation factor P maturation arginine rhamnosyltransferase EarP [Zoogloeaceae bacterium]|jgi:hypothetical protein|nr:elongation factor P maturation arginine rhamnosyltransferase EarP [Zoogloeaceae bacterium]